ncbi:MAG TPA: pyruvate kinase [Candidatus Paceibacterota bacterium]
MKRNIDIVCTLGPASDSVSVLGDMLNAGMTIGRFNFSHGDFAEHTGKLVNLRQAAQDTGKSVLVLQDLGGPKIRTGNLKEGVESITLVAGEQIIIEPGTFLGDEKHLAVNYEKLSEEVEVGEFILINDGKQKLEILAIDGTKITCKIIIGGTVKSRRGINVPGAKLTIDAFTEKDRTDIQWGIENNVDMMAVSFVRNRGHVESVRQVLDAAGKQSIKIIAKIETLDALPLVPEILEVADGIMIARGDLGVEIPFEDVPEAQLMMIKECRARNKFVITATQVLLSMQENERPTRAEVSDAYFAVRLGTDATMLSEETSIGKHPVLTVETMRKIVDKGADKELFVY